MGELDPTSMIIGALQESVKAANSNIVELSSTIKELKKQIERNNTEMEAKIDKIADTLTDQRIKMGVASGLISFIVGLVYSMFKVN